MFYLSFYFNYQQRDSSASSVMQLELVFKLDGRTVRTQRFSPTRGRRSSTVQFTIPNVTSGHHTLRV